MTNKTDWADEMAGKILEECSLIMSEEELASALRKAKADGVRLASDALIGLEEGEDVPNDPVWDMLKMVAGQLNEVADAIESRR